MTCRDDPFLIDPAQAFTVETDGRLVEQQKVGMVHHRARNLDAADLAAGERTNLLIATVGKSDEFEGLLRASGRGAAREAMEEAGADIEIGPLLGVWSVPRISQVHMMFVARMRSPHIEAGEESLEVRFFDWNQIPWGDLAFPSVVAALRRFEEVHGRDTFEAFVGPLGER